MCKHGSQADITRCFRYMRLHKVDFFALTEVLEGCIRARVGYMEDLDENGLPLPEDLVAVEWAREVPANIDDALALGECAFERGWISIDRLTTSKAVLTTALGWSPERVENALCTLLSIDVPEDGGDSFFFHL